MERFKKIVFKVFLIVFVLAGAASYQKPPLIGAEENPFIFILISLAMMSFMSLFMFILMAIWPSLKRFAERDGGVFVGEKIKAVINPEYFLRLVAVCVPCASLARLLASLVMGTWSVRLFIGEIPLLLVPLFIFAVFAVNKRFQKAMHAKSS